MAKKPSVKKEKGKKPKLKTGAQVICFNAYKKAKAKEKKILSLDIYRSGKRHQFSYRMNKLGLKKISDQFAAFSIVSVLEDIIAYNEDPENICELIEEIMIRLGYEDDVK